MNNMIFQIIFLVISILLSTGYFAEEIADTIYSNGKIWTGDSANPKATAIAIKANKIIGVGSLAELIKLKNTATKMIDLHGKRVTPGFIDNHTHFSEVSGLLSAVQLRDASTKNEFIQRIAAFASKMKSGQWMQNGIWDHEAWGGQLPQAVWIDKVTPDIPVYLWRTDGHMALANSAAMKLAGVDEKTPDIPGGEIVRDRNGKPTGIFKDAAMELISKVVPELSIEEQALYFKNGINHAISFGVTQFHDMGTWAHLNAFQKLHDENQLKMRVYSFVPVQTHSRLADYVKKHGRGDDMHRWGGLKAMVDGSLGSTTAWFYEAYDDEPDKFGFPIYDLKEFKGWISAGDIAGLHVTVHAIGDRANDWILDSFEDIAKHNPANVQRRWRIEHAQHLTPAAIKRMQALSVIPSMQPYHSIDDGRWAEKRIGPDRIQSTYAFRSLLDANARITFGSDSPVAPMNVMQGIYAAVTRRTIDGANPDGWVPAEKITLDEALKAYTVNNAYAGFQEKKLGQLSVGYLADFVVLEQDIFNIPAVQLKDVDVSLTVINGKVVYQKTD
ncbi:MAG: amidohydrolase [Gammaproteobacteria bacterium]|nr:amidohydrolase [Gammaproteobacteria bacterium]